MVLNLGEKCAGFYIELMLKLRLLDDYSRGFFLH